MGDTLTTDEMIEAIRAYAGRNRMYLELEGEVGFGRECVGLVHDGHYPAYGWNADHNDYMSEWIVTEEATPPDGVDAYHKGEYLAVLGRGDEAIRQLWAWVSKLEANNVVLKVEATKPKDAITALLHGMSRALLVVADS